MTITKLYRYGRQALGLTAMLLVTACSTDVLEQSDDTSARRNLLQGEPAKVGAVYVRNEGNTTRALNSTLKSFTLHVVDEWYETEGAIAEDIQMTKDLETGEWTSKPNFYLWDEPQNAYALSPSAHYENVSNLAFTYNSQTFDYSVPTTKQSSIMVASRLDFTKQSVNNNLIMTFRDALFTLQFQAVNEIKDVRIKVKGITLHNILPSGKWVFSKTKESRGQWTTNYDANTRVNYTQELETPVELSRTEYKNITDSAFVFMPQNLYEYIWYPLDNDWGEVGEAFEDAQTNKHLYIEVKCQIIQDKDGEELYLWGYPAAEATADKPEFESVFFPYDEYATLSEWVVGVNSPYFLEFNTITGGYDKTGQHITPHPTGGKGASVFQNAEPVKFIVGEGGNVDSWTVPGSDEVITVSGGWQKQNE